MELHEKIKNRFPYLTDENIMAVLALGEVLMLNEGDIFIKAGERAGKIGLVLEGMMRNYIINDNGEEITVVFATEMQGITPYATLLKDKAASETTAAIEPTLLFTIDFLLFKKKTESDPLLMRFYADMLETALVAAVERIEDFTKKKPEQRYRRLLEVHGFLIERVPLKYLASYLGITAVSLSRIRKRLSQNRN